MDAVGESVDEKGVDDEDFVEDPWCLRGSSQVARPNQTNTWELGIIFVLRRVWKVKRILGESFSGLLSNGQG